MLHPPIASPYNPRGHDSADTERNPKSTMAMLRKAYELRLHISLKYITANVMDTSNGQIVAQVSTIEHALKNACDLGRTTKNPQTAIVVGEILSRRIKLEALSHPGLKHGIHANVCKQIQKKGVEDENANSRIVWSIINSLRDNRIRVTVIDPDCNEV